MPCLSPFKKYIEDLFVAYDESGPISNLGAFVNDNSELIVSNQPVEFGIYPTPEYCCPSCNATDDPCGNIYFFGSAENFVNLADFKNWTTNPGSIPCCYNFMGGYDTILRLEAALCWSSIERCCNEFDTCFKTFMTFLPSEAYSDLMERGVVEYGAINDPDNICFLKTFLENRYDNPQQIAVYIDQILKASIVFVCPIGSNEVWALSVDVYKKWCSEL